MQISKWVALGVAAFCLVAVGGVVNMPHLYYMAAMLVALPGVSYLLGWYTLRGLEFTRTSPSPVWEGEETEVVYTAGNRSPIARFFVAIQEPDDPLIDSIEMNPPLFSVKAGSKIEVRNCVRYNRRGVFQAGSFDVSALDPLGVFTFTCTIRTDDETVVFPMPRPMGAVELDGASRQGWNDTISQTRRGDGVDTSGVRSYQPGDPLRHIHWRQTARTGNLTVIEFEETQSVNLRIVLDTLISGIVGDEPNTSLEYAIRAAASVSRDAIQRGASVELVDAERALLDVASGWNGLLGERGDSQIYAIMDALARVHSQPTTKISDLLASTIGTVPRGTTVLAICLQPDPELASIVAQYLAAGMVLSLIIVDGSSFPGFQTRPGLKTAIHAAAEIAAMGCAVYALAWNSEGALHAVPIDERVSYA